MWHEEYNTDELHQDTYTVEVCEGVSDIDDIIYQRQATFFQ